MEIKELFEKVKTHLLTQNSRSLNDPEFSGCAYRGAEGKSCAVGCLIPDDLYDVKIEGISASDERIIRILHKVGILDEPKYKVTDFFGSDSQKITMLRQLQLMHDSLPIELWPKRLDEIEGYYITKTILPHDFYKTQ